MHALCAEQPPRIRARSCERSSLSVSHEWESAIVLASRMSAGRAAAEDEDVEGALQVVPAARIFALWARFAAW
jgi:hypothetical protein